MEQNIKTKGRNYSMLVTEYTQAKVVPVDKCCNSWLVKNTGGVRAVVNQWPILPPPAPNLSGEVFGAEGDEGDIYKGRIDITFDAGANPRVVLTQIIYMEVEDNG